MGDGAEVVVIGAGQAGLAVSRELTQAGVDHVVLEKGKIGQTWRDRWDSFCLVTPNWSVQLPGRPYDGHDPDGFMLGDEVLGYLDAYAEGFEAPVREGVEVTSLEPGRDGAFRLETLADELTARAVVVSTGAYQRPHRPAGAATLPRDLVALDVEDYRSPGELPPEPFRAEAPEGLDLRGFGAVVFAGGFRPDYESWVRCPGGFDEFGFPITREGASTVAPGLYFVGVHFLRKRKSSLLIGVGEDASLVARQIQADQAG